MSFRRKYHSVPLGRDQFYIDVRYTNLRPIGGGSYGVVCSADDTATGRRVAIKKIRDDNIYYQQCYVVRQGDPAEAMILPWLVEDKFQTMYSYTNYLGYIHKGVLTR